VNAPADFAAMAEAGKMLGGLPPFDCDP